MKRVKVFISVLLAALFVPLLSGCGGVPQDEQKDISSFYIGFVKQGTSLSAFTISKVYSQLPPAGQKADGDKTVFQKFNDVNPAFFSHVETGSASYGDVAKTYSSALLLSLADNNAGVVDGVDITFPLDAISVRNDDKLGKVYEIDRKKITANVPEKLGMMIDRPAKESLAPVRIVKSDDSWKVLADGNMFTEVGAPKPDMINAPVSAP